MIGYVIVLGLGAFLLVKFGRDALLGRQSQTWPTASGTILNSNLEIHHHTDDEGDTSTSYTIAVHYKYNVEGLEYESRRRSFSDVRTSSRRKNEAILARYPEGAVVDVFYDPEDHSSSVLETGVGGGNVVFLILALAMIIFGLAGVLGFIG